MSDTFFFLFVFLITGYYLASHIIIEVSVGTKRCYRQQPHCTMCSLGSMFSFQRNKLRHKAKFVSWYIIQHIFVPTTQWPVSHGLGQNFDGGAGSRCPAVFSTGYGAHQGKKPGVLGAHAFFVLGTVPIKKKTSSGKTSSKQTLQGSSWTVQSKQSYDQYTQWHGYKENPTVLDRVPMSTEGKLSRIQWGWFWHDGHGT